MHGEYQACEEKCPQSHELPTCEIITIGTELLFGQILDTNTTRLAQELNKLGITIRFRTAVGDKIEDITKVLSTAVNRCDAVITTGGIGPTLDDITRESVARVAGVGLEFRQELMDRIAAIFRRYGYNMPENNRRQAYVPKGSKAIPNPVGTAPGFIKEVAGTPVICLPGVPGELEYLLGHEVAPWLRQRFNLSGHTVTYQVLKTAGITESRVDDLIGDLIKPGQNPEVGLLASEGEIKIRIAATGKNERDARNLIQPVEKEIRSRLGNKIYGMDKNTLEDVVDSLAEKHGLSLAILETFTGGLAAQGFHGLESKQLLESRVIPDEKRVREFLGLREITLKQEAALMLAQKIRDVCHAGIGLAILGFPIKKENNYSIEGYASATCDGMEKVFPFKIGGNIARLQRRGAIIGLNTLRLALLEL